jgi:hypothetical protein
MDIRIHQPPEDEVVNGGHAVRELGIDLPANAIGKLEHDQLGAFERQEGGLAVFGLQGLEAAGGELDRPIEQHELQLLGGRGEARVPQVRLGRCRVLAHRPSIVSNHAGGHYRRPPLV